MTNDLGRRLAYIGLLLTPGILAAVAAVRAWSGWLVVLLVAVALLVYSLLRPARTRPAGTRPLRTVLATGAVPIAVVVFGVASFFSARLVALDLWGEPQTVRVDGVERSDRARGDKQNSEFCYRLSRPGGEPVLGRICRTADEYAVGSRIEVLAEPTGLVAPETPDRVAGLRLALPRGLALGAFAVIVVAGAATGGNARRPASPTRRARTTARPPAPRRRPAGPRRRPAARR
ncbi:hypothetical protein AB0G04_43215 [Actinoplanes sp. NPDC023801]|uniref:hypothetical protein n=1 Tax=Actinoplanes sp. NPDC023801 TaxID=3154595 RepID=UPI0033ECD36F